MNAALWLAGAAVSTLAGMAWLALAMQTHWAQVHPTLPHADARARTLRLAGSAALAASFAACLAADHPSMAVLVWLMLLAGAGFGVAIVLSSRAAWLRWLWPVPARR